MTDVFSGISDLSQLVENIKITTESTTGQTVDEDIVSWYVKRIDLFIEDGVPGAVQSYLKHLLRDNVNDLTRAVITNYATSKLLER